MRPKVHLEVIFALLGSLVHNWLAICLGGLLLRLIEPGFGVNVSKHTKPETTKLENEIMQFDLYAIQNASLEVIFSILSTIRLGWL